MSLGPTQKMKKRLNRGISLVIIAAFLVVTVNLLNISVNNYDFYSEYANSHQQRAEKVGASRGTIYDRNMEVLAQSATAWDVTLNPMEIDDDSQRERIVEGLGDILGYDEAGREKIRALSKKKSKYEIVQGRVEKETRDRILDFITTENARIQKENTTRAEDAQLGTLVNQIDLRENTKRYYPNGTMAASVIGFVGTDNQGLYGMEAKYEEKLAGTPGYVLSLKNAFSENIPNGLEEKVDPVDGSSLVLTIDETIQHFVENSLSQAMAKYKPKKGCCAIVMNVKTAEILAMANLPTFDPNNYRVVYDSAAKAEVDALKDDNDAYIKALDAAQKAQWMNKSIGYAYQPGSTFKTIVASAALEEKTSSLNDHFYCNGFAQVADRRMNCHKTAGHGDLDFPGALVNSCNPSFIQIGARLGPANYFKYFQSFGLTAKTGIDLPGEGESIYYTEKGLQSQVVLASCSFGQSIAVTPIQLLTAVSAVTNGGYLMKPYVVKDVMDKNGNIISSVQPEIKRQVISEETSATMRTLMERVVYDKAATNAYVMGYRIGGKSGTSQKQNPGDDPNARIGSYVSVAPIDDPEIAVLVMIDEPTNGDVYGSVIAAPVTAKIMRDTLPYLGFSPKYSSSEAALMEIAVPTLLNMGVLDAESKLASVGLGKPKVIGDGVNVVRQVPTSGNPIPRDGTVILYTESKAENTVKVPDVAGMRPSAAKQRLEDADLNVIISGPTDGNEALLQITWQSLSAGSQTPIGTVIEITSTLRGTD